MNDGVINEHGIHIRGTDIVGWNPGSPPVPVQRQESDPAWAVGGTPVSNTPAGRSALVKVPSDRQGETR